MPGNWTVSLRADIIIEVESRNITRRGFSNGTLEIVEGKKNTIWYIRTFSLISQFLENFFKFFPADSCVRCQVRIVVIREGWRETYRVEDKKTFWQGTVSKCHSGFLCISEQINYTIFIIFTQTTESPPMPAGLSKLNLLLMISFLFRPLIKLQFSFTI